VLVELLVENFAVVEKLRLRFHPGMNTLTGETGSGKSLVVDALGLLLGGRASTEAVRSGAERATVSGIFELPGDPGLRTLLESSGVEAEDGEIALQREVLANGKSRAFAGGRPVTAAFLKDLAPYLGDIHGQHDQQRLFSYDAQRELLDEAGGCLPALQETCAAYRLLAGVIRELDQLTRSEREKDRLLDLWMMQRKEIDALDPVPGEDAQLENERRVLRNVAKLQESASAAFDSLSEAPDSASTGLRHALKRLEELAKIDAGLVAQLENLRPALFAVDDVSHELRHYLGKLESDPARLEEVESRLAGIERLKKKYGATIEEILAFRDDVRARISAVETAGERRAQLERDRERFENDYRATAGKLRVLRQKAAKKLEKQVENELKSLAMAKTVFRVQLEPAEPAEHGIDAVTFLVSANVGEEPKPLDKVASGGELSRIALALRTSVVAKPAPAGQRTLVFDEIDSGVGGAAAETVGRRLQQLAGANQVLCVTHLPQIAGFADHHFLVFKREVNGRTVAGVDELDRQARVREIGRMISGQKLSPEALKHAEKLIEDFAR
jgi:DNA repair protein RecN (Recombination protein N)